MSINFEGKFKDKPNENRNHCHGNTCDKPSINLLDLNESHDHIMYDEMYQME